MKENKKARQSNFELLRILCMLMIIGHHIAMHGEYTVLPGHKLSDAVIKLFTVGGKLGVNIFVLISGYFLINSRFSYKKLIKMMAQILFYSVLIAVVFVRLDRAEVTDDFIINTLFPVSKHIWWFMSAYIIMYCFSPFLNSLIKNCGKALHVELIVLLVFIQCLVQRAFDASHLSNAGWFMTLYVIASYIKLYPNKIFDSNKIMLPVSLALCVIIVAFKMCLDLNFWELTSILCLMCSVAIFCSFKNFRIPRSKIINGIAKTTLGIYLIHDNYLMRHLLWVDLFNCPMHYLSNLFIVFVPVAMITVFAGCMVIDFIRELLFDSVILWFDCIRPRKPLYKAVKPRIENG